MVEGDLADAVKRYHEALELFQRLGEPATEAVVQHQLGMAFQEARQWEQAEQHYRESARLKEQQGNVRPEQRMENLEPTGDREQVSRKARGSGDLVSQGHRRRPEIRGTRASPRSASTTSPISCEPSRDAWTRPANWPRNPWPSRRPWIPAPRRSGRPTTSWPKSPISSRSRTGPPNTAVWLAKPNATSPARPTR